MNSHNGNDIQVCVAGYQIIIRNGQSLSEAVKENGKFIVDNGNNVIEKDYRDIEDVFFLKSVIKYLYNGNHPHIASGEIFIRILEN